MSKVIKPICYGDIVYIQCDNLVLLANGQYSPILHLNSTENIALKSFRNGLFMLYPNLTYKDITQVEQLEHQLDLLKSLNPEEVYAAQQLEEDIRNEKVILEEREAKLVALNDKMFEESKGQPIKYNQKVQLFHIESQSFVTLSNLFDKEDKSMNYLELTKEGSKNLYFEFASKLAIQEREIVDYDTPISLVSNKTQAGLKLGVEIDKKTIKTEINPASNKLCTDSEDFPDVQVRRLEPIYQTEKVYTAGMSEVIGTEAVKVKKFISYQDQMKADSKKYLKNGDYIRISTNRLFLYAIHKRADDALFFQAFSNSQEYRFNNVNTLFQIIDVSDSRVISEEGTRDPFNPNTLPEGHILEYNEQSRYVLKHFVSGKFLTFKDRNLGLHEISDATKLQKVALIINGRSETDQLNNYIDKNAVLQIKCFDDTGKEEGTFQSGDVIKLPNVQLEKNTWYFYGFFNTDNYLNKWTRPERFSGKISESIDFINSSFKFVRVSDEEFCSMQVAEGFANEVQRFIDFLYEFQSGNPENLKEFNQNILKVAKLCTRYSQEMYETEYHEANEDILVPNNLRQTLLREFRVFNLFYPTLKYLIEDESFKKKVEQLMKKSTDEGRAQTTANLDPAPQVKDEEAAALPGNTDEILMEPVKSAFIAAVAETIEKATTLDELREIDHVSFELLIRNIRKLIINSFKKNDLNHFYCSQFVRIPINCVTKDKDGIAGYLPDKQRKLIKGYMLELCKQGLWDQDLDALGQLNFYEAAVFEALENQGTYHPYYIELMQHISSSKAPNLQNLIRDNMIFNFLKKDANVAHLFPRLYEQEGKMWLEFTRKKHEEENRKLCLDDQVAVVSPKVKRESNLRAEVQTLFKYFQESLNLIFGLNGLDSSMFKLKIMRYYTYQNLTKAVDVLKTSSRFREIRALLSDLISTIHQNYLSFPFIKLPKQLQILDHDSTYQAKISRINTIITDSIKTGVTESERTYLKDEDAEDIIETVLATVNKDNHIDEINKLIQSDPNIEDLEQSRIMLEEIQKSFGSNIEVQFEFLRRSRHVIVSLINQARQKEGKVYVDFVKQALEVFQQMDAKTVSYAATEITSQLKKQYLNNKEHNQPKKRVKKVKSPDSLDNSGIPFDSLDSDDNLNLKLNVNKVSPADAHSRERSDRRSMSENIIASSTLEALARQWKTGERFLHDPQSDSEQNPFMVGDEKKQMQEMQDSLHTVKAYNMLLDIFLLKQPHLLSDVIQQLRKLSSFESNLYRELDKLTILQDFESLKKVEEIVKITFKLNELAREIFFCQDSLIEIEKERLPALLNEVLENQWKLFFIIYDTSKHFRYHDPNYESSDQRFRQAFESYKKPRWDKILSLVPQAINTSFQKIFNILKTYHALFKTMHWILDKKAGFDDEFLTHTYIFRLNTLLLYTFVQNNKENQFLFSNSRGIIRQFYNQHFLNQSPDTMLVFAEIFRNNKKLLKLPVKYLYDITMSTFVGTMSRSITNTETNAYLASGIMSYTFMGRAQIPIELYNPLSDMKTKFLQAASCDDFTSLNILDSTEEIFESPYCYYSIRGLFNSFLELYDHFASDIKAVKELQSILLFDEWLRFFQNKNFILQYELKNLAAKCFIKNYFKTSSKGSPIIQDTNECLKIVSGLLAEILFFRKHMAQQKNQNSSELNRLTENPSFVINNEAYIAVTELLKGAHKINFETKKLKIFLENITLENLFVEYIYEGCLELLFHILLKFHKFSSETIDSRNDAKSIISFVLEVLTEFIEFEGNNDAFPFKKVEDFLSKASSFKEYVKSRPTIIRITNRLYAKLKAKGRALDKRVSILKKTDAHQTYRSAITPLYNFKRESKEQNIKQVAEQIAEHPQSKEIITEIIAYLKRDVNKLDHEEIVFILRLLRKYIEIENTNNPDEDPIYMWKEVGYVDLKKIERVQDSYRSLGLSPLLYTFFSVNDHRIYRETLLLSLAYMYGGNTDVQKDFYENFKNDDENRVIRQIRDKLESFWVGFKKHEQKRVDSLYHASHKTLFEYFSGKKSEKDVNLDELQLVVSKMNLDQKTTQLAEKEPENEQFLLTLTFLQCLCEKQFTSMQNFLREQKVDDHVFTKSFDVLNFLRHGMNSYYKVLNRYNLSIGNKVLDLIIELIQGEVHENITVLLHKTFVHDLCRILTDYNARYHTLPRGFGLNIFHENFREFKSKIIFIFKTMLENRNDKNIEILAEHLDIRGLMNTFQSLMADFVTKKNLYKKINSTTQFIFSLENEDFKDTLGDAINIYIIFRYLWDDRDTFNEKLREQIKLLDKSHQDFMDKIVFHIFRKLVRSIEIIAENKSPSLIRIWYPTIAMCHYLNKDTKYNFTKYVDRSNTQTKISALIDSSQEFIPQMDTDYQARNRILGFNLLNFLDFIRLLTNAIALFITFFNVGTYTYNDGAEQDSEYKTVTQVLNYVQMALALFLVIGWLGLLSKRNQTVKWERYVDKNIKRQGFLPPTLKNKLDNGDYKDLSEKECVNIMELKGANTDEFKEMKKNATNFHTIALKYFFLESYFTIASKEFFWHLIYLGITIGSKFHPLVAVFQILDIAIRADTIVQIYSSISRNVFQFLWTLFLLVITNVTYALIGFFFMNEKFQNSDTPLCETAFACFLNVLNLGLRSGGGIADVIGAQPYSSDHIGLFVARVIFDLSFFIIMIILLLNLIFGMIIDAFGELRDQKTRDEEDQKNICFICGIDRSEFERHCNFEEHTVEEHNIWSYVFYLVYLVEKQKISKTEMTDIENLVLERYLIKSYEWVPVGKSLTLEKIYEKENVNKEDNIEYIQKKVEGIQHDVINLSKQLNTSLIGDLKASIQELNGKVQVNQKPAYIQELFRKVEDIQKSLAARPSQ